MKNHKISFSFTFVQIFISGFFMIPKNGKNIQKIEISSKSNSRLSAFRDTPLKAQSLRSLDLFEGSKILINHAQNNRNLHFHWGIVALFLFAPFRTLLQLQKHLKSSFIPFCRRKMYCDPFGHFQNSQWKFEEYLSKSLPFTHYKLGWLFSQCRNHV